MRRTLLIQPLALLVVLVVSACGSESPVDVIQAYYSALREGNYDEAERYLSKEAKQYMEVIAGSVREATLLAAAFETAKEVEVLREEVLGDKVRLHLSLHYEKGRQSPNTELLVKEAGRWRIGIDR